MLNLNFEEILNTTNCELLLNEEERKDSSIVYEVKKINKSRELLKKIK
jgi:hypothetical protein